MHVWKNAVFYTISGLCFSFVSASGLIRDVICFSNCKIPRIILREFYSPRGQWNHSCSVQGWVRSIHHRAWHTGALNTFHCWVNGCLNGWVTGKVSHFPGDVPIRNMMKDTCLKLLLGHSSFRDISRSSQKQMKVLVSLGWDWPSWRASWTANEGKRSW